MDGNWSLSAVLDYDDSCYGYMLYDLGASFIFWCYVKPDCDNRLNIGCKDCKWALDLEYLEVFTRMYEGSRGFDLTDGEISLLSRYFVRSVLGQMEFMPRCEPEVRMEE